MTSYADLHWESLNFLKRQLYRRLASALNNALGRLALARHIDEAEAADQQFRRAENGLEMALNLLRAWAALIHIESGGDIGYEQRRPLAPNALPVWLVDHLAEHVTFKAGHTRPVSVHPAALYESLLLLAQLGAAAGGMRALVTADATGEGGGVWLRAVFAPPPDGPYTGLVQLGQRLRGNETLETDALFMVDELRALARLNGGRFTLQNNSQTDEQALACWLPEAPAGSAEAGPGAEADMLAQAVEQDADPDAVQHRLSGDVLAATPHEVTPPLGDALVVLDAAQHTISGPVLAPTPQVVDDTPGEAAPDTPDTAGKETLIVPPPDFKQRLAEAEAAAEPETPAAPGRETLIVPPPDFKQRLAEAEAAAEPETPAAPGDEVDHAAQTLIVPPPDFKRRLMQVREADADADVELESQPADSEPPGSAGDSAPEQNAPGQNAPDAPARQE